MDSCAQIAGNLWALRTSYLFGLWRWFYLNRSKQIGISYWRKRLEKNRMIERQNVGHSPGEKI